MWPERERGNRTAAAAAAWVLTHKVADKIIIAKVFFWNGSTATTTATVLYAFCFSSLVIIIVVINDCYDYIIIVIVTIYINVIISSLKLVDNTAHLRLRRDSIVIY